MNISPPFVFPLHFSPGIDFLTLLLALYVSVALSPSSDRCKDSNLLWLTFWPELFIRILFECAQVFAEMSIASNYENARKQDFAFSASRTNFHFKRSLSFRLHRKILFHERLLLKFGPVALSQFATRLFELEPQSRNTSWLLSSKKWKVIMRWLINQEWIWAPWFSGFCWPWFASKKWTVH